MDIAANPALHPEIVALCNRTVGPDERLAAALVREHWDQVGAADTLVSIIESSGVSVRRPVRMGDALAVADAVARTAALCLMNIDDGRGNVSAGTEVSRSYSTGASASNLDALQRVHELACSGGLDHAFHRVGDEFPQAASGLEALGLGSAAEVLREFERLCPMSPGAAADRREAALAGADSVRVVELVAKYDVIAGRVQALIDGAS